LVSIFALEIIAVVAHCTDPISHANSDKVLLEPVGVSGEVFNHDERPSGTALAEEVAIWKHVVVLCSGGNAVYLIML
jgi:hypothetical protein